MKCLKFFIRIKYNNIKRSSAAKNILETTIMRKKIVRFEKKERKSNCK
jgi:hypothetical protein